MYSTLLRKPCTSCGTICRTSSNLCDACTIAQYRESLREFGLVDNICESCKKETTEFFIGGFSVLCCKECADAEWGEMFHSSCEDNAVDDFEPGNLDDGDDSDLEAHAERRRKWIAEQNEY